MVTLSLLIVSVWSLHYVFIVFSSSPSFRRCVQSVRTMFCSKLAILTIIISMGFTHCGVILPIFYVAAGFWAWKFGMCFKFSRPAPPHAWGWCPTCCNGATKLTGPARPIMQKVDFSVILLILLLWGLNFEHGSWACVQILVNQHSHTLGGSAQLAAVAPTSRWGRPMVEKIT